MSARSTSHWSCPHCGSTDILLNGTSESGKQKYHCEACNKFGEMGLDQMSIQSVLTRMQSTPAIRGAKLLHPEIRALVRAKFSQELTPIAVPTAYAQTLFNFIAFTDQERYVRELPPESWRMIELWKPFFRYISRYGLVDDSRWLNEIISFELMKVYADDILEPQHRVTAIYAAGNLLYLIQLLEDFADYPFRKDSGEPSQGTGQE